MYAAQVSDTTMAGDDLKLVSKKLILNIPESLYRVSMHSCIPVSPHPVFCALSLPPFYDRERKKYNAGRRH